MEGLVEHSNKADELLRSATNLLDQIMVGAICGYSLASYAVDILNNPSDYLSTLAKGGVVCGASLLGIALLQRKKNKQWLEYENLAQEIRYVAETLENDGSIKCDILKPHHFKIACHVGNALSTEQKMLDKIAKESINTL